MAVTTDSFLGTVAERQAASSPRAGLLGILRLWRRRSIERAMLARMSQRDIADMGVTEAEIRYEVDKPFWRA